MAKHMSSDGNGYKPKGSSRKQTTPARNASQSSGRAVRPQPATAGYMNEVQRVKNTKKKKGGIRPWHVVLIVVAIVLVLGGVCGALLYRDVKTVKADADSLMSEVSTMKDAIKNGDGEQLKQVTGDIAYTAGQMNKTVQSPWWIAAEFIPVYGQDVSQARVLLATLDNLSTQVLVPLGDTLAGVKLSELLTDGTINVGMLQTVITAVDEVKEPLQEAIDTVNAMQPFHIEKLESTMADVRDKLSSADTILEESDKILPYLPGMLGADGQTQTYLVVALNNVETRSLAGFPGSMGLLTVTDGKMELGEFQSVGSYLTDDDPLPQVSDDEYALLGDALQKNPGTTLMLPDFSRAASLIAQIWEIRGGQHVNGVIGADVNFLQSLLKLTGGITTSFGVEINGDNATKVLMSDTYWNYDTATQDIFFATVASEAFEHVFANLGKAGITDLADTVMDAFDNGNFQIWSENEDYENALIAMGAARTLSTDETKPILGVYVNDATWSKIGWYMDVQTTIGEATKNADGSTTYQVTTVLTNKMTYDEAIVMPEYVYGYLPAKRSTSDIVTQVFFMAPAGGSIDNMQATGGQVDGITKTSLYGFQMYNAIFQDALNESTTVTYAVTTSTNATEELMLEKTPQARSFSE